MGISHLEAYDALAFDIEGTLANTIPTHHAARLEAFSVHGFGHITQEQHNLGTTYGSYPTDIIGGVLHAAGEIEETGSFRDHPVVQAVVKTKSEIFEELALTVGFDEMPGAIDFVNTVAPRFAGRMALVTSSAERLILPFLDRYDLNRLFAEDLVITDDTITSEGLRGKPSPDPYLLAERRLGSTNMLGFEDTVPGVASLKSAGATAIALGFDTENAKAFRSGTLEYPPDALAMNYAEAKTILGI